MDVNRCRFYQNNSGVFVKISTNCGIFFDQFLVRGVGFGPTNPYGIAASGRKSAPIDEIDAKTLVLFKKWLFKNYRPFTANPRYCYAKKFAHCLLERDLSNLRMLSDCKREHVLKALSSLSKFLGIHEDFRRLVKNYGLKWSGRNSDDVIISRLLKNVNAGEIFQWIRDTKTNVPELNSLLDLMAITGLRLIEAIESINLIIHLNREGKLNTYYDVEKQTLEHFRFKETFIRNSKKVFISFVPKELIQKIAQDKPLDYDSVQKVTEWRMKKLRFGDIRELHASMLTRHLSQPEIDFLHGRVSTNVFMTNYFNVNLISDLRQRVFGAIKEIQTQVS
jgi:intergrase/recombinase